MGDLSLRDSASIQLCIRPTLLGQREMLLHTAYHGRVRVVCTKFLMQDGYGFESS
jgi:hypothetical protein